MQTEQQAGEEGQLCLCTHTCTGHKDRVWQEAAQNQPALPPPPRRILTKKQQCHAGAVASDSGRGPIPPSLRPQPPSPPSLLPPSLTHSLAQPSAVNPPPSPSLPPPSLSRPSNPSTPPSTPSPPSPPSLPPSLNTPLTSPHPPHPPPCPPHPRSSLTCTVLPFTPVSVAMKPLRLFSITARPPALQRPTE